MDAPKPFEICFVCLGNICRSPLAEGVFQALINEEGKQITPYKYDEITTFSGGKAIGEIDYYWGLIDTDGSEISEFKYEQIQYIFGSVYIRDMVC